MKNTDGFNKKNKTIFEHDKRYVVLSGGPATGKSSILTVFADKGLPCLPEAARHVITTWQNNNVLLPWEKNDGNSRQGTVSELQDEIAWLNSKWLKDLNYAINCNKLGDNRHMISVYRNTAVIETTQALAESMIGLINENLYKKSYCDTIKKLIKCLHRKTYTLLYKDSYPESSLVDLTRLFVHIPSDILPDIIKDNLQGMPITTANVLAQVIDHVAEQAAKSRFNNYKKLSQEFSKTIVMDRGALDPLAFNQDFLVKLDVIMAAKGNIYFKYDDIIRAAYSASNELGKTARLSIDAVMNHGNVLCIEVPQLPSSLYISDAQRHENFTESRKQHQDVLRVYGIFNRNNKTYRIKQGHKSPEERALEALNIIQHNLPHHLLHTSSSIAKRIKPSIK